MHKIYNSVVSIVLLFAMIFSLTSCNSSNKEVENLMYEFQYACNTLDFNAVLDCINPKISNKIKIAVGFVEKFTNTDTDVAFESISEYLLNDDLTETEFFSSIEIGVEDISIDDESAVVYATLTYQLDGEEFVRESTFNCVYYIEKWYISSFVLD